MKCAIVNIWIPAVLIVAVGLVCLDTAAQPKGKLEIHYINVGQGGSTLIVGPDGTKVLYDFGNRGRGKRIVEYLEHIGIDSTVDIDYTIVSHRDSDHYSGYGDVIDAGYDVTRGNFGPGSPKPATRTMDRVWLERAKETTAGAVQPIQLGMQFFLGDGATITVIAANGKVFRTNDADVPKVKNENDRSVSLYLKYKEFDYILDGDLGAGRESCTDHDTSQRNFQVPVAKALIAQGLMDEDKGVDVLHIAHHGSESSTSAAYYNLMKPEVGLISVGLNQGTFLHPRVDVVDRVLLDVDRPGCVEAPPLQGLFQTEVGKPGSSSTGSTSFKGLAIGSILLETDGDSVYRITGSQRQEDGTYVRHPTEGHWEFAMD